MSKKCCDEKSQETNVKIPDKHAPEWTEYFKSHFTDDEVKEGFPTTAGIRRVCEKVYGSIILAGADVKHISDKEVVTSYTIHCVEHNTSNKIMVSSLANASYDNTDPPYSLHLPSTAETKAEGRALRKLLCLNFHTYEEMELGETQCPAKDVSIRAIEKNVKSKSIDLDKFLAKYAGLTKKHLNTKNMTSDMAEKLLNQLNEFDNDEEIPGEILQS